jgi:hypothetical protein
MVRRVIMVRSPRFVVWFWSPCGRSGWPGGQRREGALLGGAWGSRRREVGRVMAPARSGFVCAVASIWSSTNHTFPQRSRGSLVTLGFVSHVVEERFRKIGGFGFASLIGRHCCIFGGKLLVDGMRGDDFLVHSGLQCRLPALRRAGETAKQLVRVIPFTFDDCQRVPVWLAIAHAHTNRNRRFQDIRRLQP